MAIFVRLTLLYYMFLYVFLPDLMHDMKALLS